MCLLAMEAEDVVPLHCYRMFGFSKLSCVASIDYRSHTAVAVECWTSKATNAFVQRLALSRCRRLLVRGPSSVFGSLVSELILLCCYIPDSPSRCFSDVPVTFSLLLGYDPLIVCVCRPRNLAEGF